MNAIEIKNLFFKYNDNYIFKNLNLNFEYNKIYLISSKTGLGKTTLLSLINGKLTNYNYLTYDGDIFINDINIKDKNLSYISGLVSSVFQNPDHQIVENTVEDEIAFGLENNNFTPSLIYEKVDKITKLLKLEKNDNPNYLSGGQKQKLVIASNLVLSKKILLLDEPLAHLDNKTSIELLEILNELKNKYHMCIIICEHKIEQIFKYVDYIYEIDNLNLNLKPKDEIKKNIDTFKIENKNKDNNKSFLYQEDKILLSLKNLNYKIKNKLILKNINLDIYEGEKVLIIGENGQGKTTLLEIISKLIKVKKEEYIIKKLKSIKKQKKWFDIFGQIFQNPNYQLFNKTVEEEILFQLKENDYIKELINDLNLNKYLKKHPFSLSEGEKRRVAICSILAKLPNICLFDEPSVGQDIQNLKNIYNIIYKINKKYNTTFIVVSHDINFINYDFDRIIWLKDNTIYKIGNKELIYEYLKGENKID